MLKRVIAVPTSILLLLLSLALPVSADSSTTPISQYMLTNEAMMLRHANDEYSISIPISDRVQLQSATLNLVLTNSNVVRSNRSQIVVYVNDYVIGQIKLDPINNNTQAKFQIDREYLKHGYNKITFKAAQHYTDSQCEDWSAPELWSQIDTTKTTFTLNYDTTEISEKLSALNELINDRLGRYPLTILRADNIVSDQYLYWGAMISQGVKLRLNYVPLLLEENIATSYSGDDSQFAIDPATLKNDTVLVGTKAQIGQLIPAKINEAIQGPYLGIFRQDHNNTHFILVVSGNNNEQVSTAAQSLALLNARFPDQQQTVLQNLPLPNVAELNRPNTIAPGQTYQFSQLVYSNDLAKQHRATLEFQLPADLYSTEESMVRLNLDLAYGAAMRQDSVINIELNDTFVSAIHLKEISGARYRNYQIAIPLRNFRPGLNSLQFNAELTPSESGECTYVQRKNLVTTIYANSTISFPEAGHVAQLPDLKLFSRTGFPLAQNASAKGTVFKLLDTSSDSIAAAWHFIATIANHQQVPLFDVNITQGDLPTADNIALIGKTNGIAAVSELFEHAPVKLGASNQYPYPFMERQSQNELSFFEWLDRTLFSDTTQPKSVEISKANVTPTQTGGLGKEFLLLSYPNPKGQGVVLALVSNEDNRLNQGLHLLTSPALWSEVQGNVFVWDTLKRFHWQQAGDTITLGDDNLRLSLTMHFSNHPWQWLLLISILLLITAWITHKLLIKFQRSKH